MAHLTFTLPGCPGKWCLPVGPDQKVDDCGLCSQTGVWIVLFVCLDLSNMFELLSPVEDGLDVLALEFEDHLTNTGLAVMQSLQGENVRKLT